MDDVFVFINTYRQATHLEDPQLRMIHTIQTAGKATFFTSLTTAAAYAANVFSQVGDCPLSLPQPPHLSPTSPAPSSALSTAPSLEATQPLSQALAKLAGSIFVTYHDYQNLTNEKIIIIQIKCIIDAH